METDRELLELAARAYGFGGPEHKFCWTGSEYPRGSDLSGALWNYIGHMDTAVLWNPLTDDGDALRLAAKLKIDLEWQATSMHPAPEIEAYRRDDAEGRFYCANEHENDYRRAIVRAAAEIGRAAGAAPEGKGESK